jgi:hypothetical protein
MRDGGAAVASGYAARVPRIVVGARSLAPRPSGIGNYVAARAAEATLCAYRSAL